MNPNLESSVKEKDLAPGKPKRFASRQEAREYLDAGSAFSDRMLDTNAQSAPWDKPVEDITVLRPRNEFDLTIQYVATYELDKQVKSEMKEIPVVHFHEGYSVPDEAPEKVKKNAQGLRQSISNIPVSIATYEHVLDEIRQGKHQIQKDIEDGKTSGDQKLVDVRTQELKTLTKLAEDQIVNLKETLKLAEDETAWKSRYHEAAGLLKRARELVQTMTKKAEELNKNPNRPPSSDEDFIQSVENQREYDALMRSGLVAMGNPTLDLYLYKHPETVADHRFEASDNSQKEQTVEKETERGVSQEKLIKEGFVEVKPVWPRTPLFSSMEAGSFKTLAYTDEEVKADPGRVGYVYSILYKDPEGRTFEKVLANNEQYGWTSFSVNSLLTVLTTSEVSQLNELSFNDLNTRDQKALDAGFVLAKKPTESLAAIFDALHPGQFQLLGYPEADKKANRSLTDRAHTILYKNSAGERLTKDLRDRTYSTLLDYGMSTEDAENLVKEMQRVESA